MKSLSNIALSMLDLVAVREGASVGQALDVARQTVQHAERLGFSRYWVAEHHNMTGIASSATAVLVATVSATPVVEYTKVLPGTVKPSHLLMGRPAMVPVPPVGCVTKAPLL
jgi:hypothetical protein